MYKIPDRDEMIVADFDPNDETRAKFERMRSKVQQPRQSSNRQRQTNSKPTARQRQHQRQRQIKGWKLRNAYRFPQACRLRILARFLFSVDCVRLEKSLPTQDTFGHPQPEPAGPHFLEVQAETLGSIGSRKLLESRAIWKLRAGETGMRSTGYSDTSAVPQRFILFYRSLFPDSMVQTKTLATAADPPLAELTTTTTAIVLC
ncbi:unnamed protein product [[Candida] boidinii]|nr:unnamed protein product [[Candida] boidinii]